MQTPYTVSGITQVIKNFLEPNLVRIRVQGEVTNLRHPASGHLYFTLKDQNAQLSSVLFKGSAAKLNRLPKDGDEVILEGSISVYAPRGGYQLIAQSVEYLGVGDLLLKFHQMKERLVKEGLFDSERKKALPPFPKTIGVVTSPSGAVIRDILHVLERRSAGFHVIVNPVRVQGKGSEIEIAMAIEQFNQLGNCDVIIVARGGGSLEDLWPFNEECVARAIARSKIPVISAVGHETDYTIADFCADLRAPTPSAAAEVVMQEAAAQLNFIAQAKRQISSLLLERVRGMRAKLSRFSSHPSLQSPDMLLMPHAQKVDEIGAQIDLAMERKLQTRTQLLEKMAVHIQAINPKAVLKKGYCIPLFVKKSSAILSSKSLNVGDEVKLVFHDGAAKTQVCEVDL